jgi:hypothetical protein
VFISSLLLVQSPITARTSLTISLERAAENIELVIDYGNSTQQVFSGLSGTTAFDALNKSASIAYIEHSFGRFVTSINGVANNANGNGRYWQFWVNDELAPIATDFYELAPENASTGSPLGNPGLWVALILIACFAALIIGIALLVNRRFW